MRDGNQVHTHCWSYGDAPHTIKQDGATILHHRCVHCGRDFANDITGSGWRAAHVGLLRIEFLAENVTERWLTEPCPKRMSASDEEDRATRQS